MIKKRNTSNPKNKLLQCRTNNETKAEVEIFAKQQSISTSEAVHELVSKGLETMKQ
ncbi:hypothetical protein [Bacillus sp. AFS002410]|uniref:hypothetical protein n=1 Tax=Bacillus sp. AFS002410 TaxID=2033481 RepID=UPI0015CEFDA2|nr:hypothetical protein [Bacillus sp. AFS002410]